MRGKAHEPEVKAQVMAALLAGQGVAEVARDYRLSESTVREWRNGMDSEEFAIVRAKKGECLEELLFGYLAANLTALRKQVEIASTEDYVRKQPAGELAVLHGVMADKGIRLLEAISRARGGAGSSE